MTESPKRNISTGGTLNSTLDTMVMIIVVRNSTLMMTSTRRTSLRACTSCTSPCMPRESSSASSRTPQAAGIDSASRVRISTLWARKIINVVTSPVMSATPPEFTAKTTRVMKRICFFLSSFSDRISAQETSVAVMLSAREENTKQNAPVSNRRYFSLMRLGMIR